MRTLLALIALGLTAACAAPFTLPVVTTERITADYATWGGTWNTGGGISAVVRVYPREDGTLVCGAWAEERQSTLTIELNRDVMQAASAFIGGQRLVHGLHFMPEVPWADNVSGATANCVLSPVAWQPAFAGMEPVLRFPRMVYPDIEDADEGLTFRNDRVFRQVPRADIAR